MHASMQVVFYSICGLYYFDGPYRIKRNLFSGRAGPTFRVHLFFCHQTTQTLEGTVVRPAAVAAAAAAAGVVFRYITPALRHSQIFVARHDKKWFGFPKTKIDEQVWGRALSIGCKIS
jgi:hypothetical protein